MRTIVLVMAAWALTVTVSYGQIKATIAGSAEARQEAYDFFERLAQEKKEHEQLIIEDWRSTTEHGFVQITGEVTNNTSSSLKNVTAVATFYTAEGKFVKSSEAFISYNPILAGQTSPFKVLTSGNPAIKKVSIAFKFFLGGTISTTTRKELKTLEELESKLQAVIHKWTDSTYKFQVVAKFVEFKNGRVHLERKGDGKKIELPMSRLSKEDQEFIREILRRQLKERKPT